MILLLYAASAPLLFGLAGAAYLLIIWAGRGRRPSFVLYWAFGLALIGWPQLPIVLEYAHVRFTLTDFNPLFAVTVPLAFLGLLLIYLGAEAASESDDSYRFRYALTLWFAASWIVSIVFFRDSRVLNTYTLQLIALLLFFAPAYLLTLRTLWRWQGERTKHNRRVASGLLLVISATVVGLVQVLFTLRELLFYSPSFWFVAISSLALLMLGDVTVFALALGACLLACTRAETAVP